MIGKITFREVRPLKVLIIEDDQDINNNVCFYLQLRYPESIIISAGNGSKGIQMVETEYPDLVMIDSSLPDIDHYDLIRQIRSFSDVPLIMLSAQETEIDRAKELEAGADDSLPKPISPIELLARVKALLRRARGTNINSDQKISFNGELSIDLNTHEVFHSGTRVKLTPIEYKLLIELVMNEGKILTHRDILNKVWGPGYAADESFVKKYIYRLRCKLWSDGNRDLVNERGIGYKLNKHPAANS